MRQSPAEVIDWTKRCIVELIQSVIDDVNKGRIFAYLTRWRDPEELYTRVLYAMFVAPADHLPHIFSGDMPNGFAAMWRKVNEIVIEKSPPTYGAAYDAVKAQPYCRARDANETTTNTVLQGLNALSHGTAGLHKHH